MGIIQRAASALLLWATSIKGLYISLIAYMIAEAVMYHFFASGAKVVGDEFVYSQGTFRGEYVFILRKFVAAFYLIAFSYRIYSFVKPIANGSVRMRDGFSSKSMINLYMKVRSAVFFMARPLFYVMAAVMIVLALDGKGTDNPFEMAALWVMQSVVDFVNFLMFGIGKEQPDLMLIFCVTVPSLIAISWWSVERVTGIHALLKRNSLI